MDRSFLSRPEVIAASREFVCVRLATYEDPVEAKFVQGLVRTRSGDVENTAFALLAPDGKTKLSRSARGTEQVYPDAAAMAADMRRVVGRYSPKAAVTSLPLAANPRLGLDVAAADGLPLVVIVGKDPATRQRLVDRLARFAWTDECIGRFVYAEGTAAEVIGASGTTVHPGVVVIAPDRFGQKGTVLRQVGAEATADAVSEALRGSVREFRAPVKSFPTHVREGQQLGVFWETRVPVTDSMEQAARERGRRIAQPPPKE
jgi:hypothetical protein